VPEAFFYQLSGEAPETVLPRLLDMGLSKGWRIELRGTARERMERLDLALWGASVIAGVGRLITLENGQEAEFAIIVNDRYQGQGIGSKLLHQLVEIGRSAGLARIVAEILPENHGMVHLARTFGFRIKHIPHDTTLMAVLDL